jgi:hypothetical protein
MAPADLARNGRMRGRIKLSILSENIDEAAHDQHCRGGIPGEPPGLFLVTYCMYVLLFVPDHKKQCNIVMNCGVIILYSQVGIQYNAAEFNIMAPEFITMLRCFL